jgi:hypothetical protein
VGAGGAATFLILFGGGGIQWHSFGVSRSPVLQPEGEFNLALSLGLGFDAQIGRTKLLLEVRDLLSTPEGFYRDDQVTWTPGSQRRHDVEFSVGLRLPIR